MIATSVINTEKLNFNQAVERLKKVVKKTPLEFNKNLSEKYNCQVFLKREDLQVVRSYKIRGAYNLMSSLPADKLSKGVVCASAGNHAQGFAYSCKLLGARGVVFMPVITPQQKVQQTKMFGEDFIEVRMVGDNFDDCAFAAKAYTLQHQMTFIPPFDDEKIIEGQGTVGLEIANELSDIDYVLIPVGGGGLAAGVGSFFNTYYPATKIIGVEPEGAASMKAALEHGEPVTLPEIDKFVDGASVKRVGDITFKYCKKILQEIIIVPSGKVCSTILKLYNENAIVVEPAGALSIAALDAVADQIIGKRVVCIVSGSNNDIDRMQEIKERSLQYEGLKHYFLVRFAQRPGALKQFINHVLGPTDDITRFEYMQKHNKEMGPALVGIELQSRDDYDSLLKNMEFYNVNYVELNKDSNLFEYVI
ncbi:MAG: threonine ammonia-lyase [Chitinophagaceae bacterium]